MFEIQTTICHQTYAAIDISYSKLCFLIALMLLNEMCKFCRYINKYKNY